MGHCRFCGAQLLQGFPYQVSEAEELIKKRRRVSGAFFVSTQGISLSLASIVLLSTLYWETRSLILPFALGSTAQALSVYGVSCVPYGCKNALSWV